MPSNCRNLFSNAFNKIIARQMIGVQRKEIFNSGRRNDRKVRTRNTCKTKDKKKRNINMNTTTVLQIVGLIVTSNDNGSLFISLFGLRMCSDL